MSRYHIDATWHDDHVAVIFSVIAPLTPDQKARLTRDGVIPPETAALRPELELVGRLQIADLRITELGQMTPKRVKETARAWLAEYDPEAGYVEFQIAISTHLEELERFAARVEGSPA